MKDLKQYIYNVVDWPIKGVNFKDITTLISNGEVFHYVTEQFSKFALSVNAEVIVAPESRGFVFATPVASNLKIGFVPVRKPNKLPRETYNYDYDLEYGKNTLCIHKDAIKKGQKVLIIDDVLATGGTIEAAKKLVQMSGGIVVGYAFVMAIDELHGEKKLKDSAPKLILEHY
jgi:adenine phosphoribosyltransferase